MKFAGYLGFADYVETEPSIFEEEIVERAYRGDVFKKTIRNSNNDTINNNVSVNVRISIVADRYALTHSGSIKYIVYMGQKWTVEDVDIQPPRLTFTLGSLYHANRPSN